MKKIEEILTKKYIDFLKKKSIDVQKNNEFESEDSFFRIKKFFNLSDKKELIKINNEYEGRFDKEYFIIADVDNGDYLLMNKEGIVFFWNHELNDLGYDKDAEKPILISKTISEFLKELRESSETDLEPDVESIKVSDDFNELFKDFLK